MQKRRFLFIALMCCFVFAGSILVACNGEDSDFTVSFDTQGGSNIADITVGNGQVIGEVAPPAKQCARFIGFALDAGGERMWNLQTDTVSADITLYAIWEDTHTWGEWETLTEPTCTAEGAHKHICEACGKEETENISKTEHDFTTWEYDENHHWKICSHCGAISEKTAHVYDTDGKCECGAMESTPASEFTFTDLGNNTWRVDGYSGSDSAIVIPSRYNGGKVIRIGYEAFAYCRGLTSVTIPDSVTSIGYGAFYNCSGLTSITIPDSVTSIGDYAFYNCDGLTSINIPDGVTSIGDSAFYECMGLTSINIPDGVTSIGDRAFYNCSGLTSINIPDGVTRIGDFAFSGCSDLTSVTIPDSVTSIGDYAFYRCTGLTSVTIGDGVTSIGDEAFDYCYKLVEVYNKSSLSITAGSTSNGYIGYYAKNVYTAEGGSWLTDTSDGYRFLYDGTNGYLIGYYGDETELTLPASFTAHNGTEITEYGIYDYAFYSCDGLTSVAIGDGVTSIGSYAFSGCSGLTSVTIPDSVTSIGDDAFEDCTGLTSVTIGEGVTSIGAGAFDYCTGLVEINWNAVSVADLGSSVFDAAGTAGDGITVTFGDSVEMIPAYLFNSWGHHPNIKSVIIGSNVTSIGNRAFRGCTGLTSVTIPESVTSIGYEAFRNCTGLTSITVNENNLNYKSIDGNVYSKDGTVLVQYAIGKTANTFEIPDSVTSIGYGAFYGCDDLTSITIPDSVTSIESSAFYGCTNLIQKENGVSYVDKWVIDCDSSAGEVTLRNDTMGIGDYAFEDCTGLTSVTIGDSVTSIGDYAFYDCTGLTEINWNAVSVEDLGSDVFKHAGTAGDGIAVTFGDSVEKIPAYLFDVSWSSDSPNIKSVTIGSNVTSIGDWAFYDCNGLTSITIPNSVTSIGDRAFSDCSGLTSVTIGDSVTSIGDYAFSGCTGLTSVTIPDSVTSIGDWAFDGCTGLTSVTIGAGVTSIGYRAFYDCSGLTSVTIGDGVTSIGDDAFRSCTGLTSVTIGAGVTSIGNYAFEGCTSLLSVTFEETSGWFVSSFSSATSGTDISADSLSDKYIAAEYLTDTYYNYYWKRNA